MTNETAISSLAQVASKFLAAWAPALLFITGVLAFVSPQKNHLLLHFLYGVGFGLLVGAVFLVVMGVRALTTAFHKDAYVDDPSLVDKGVVVLALGALQLVCAVPGLVVLWQFQPLWGGA